MLRDLQRTPMGLQALCAISPITDVPLEIWVIYEVLWISLYYQGYS